MHGVRAFARIGFAALAAAALCGPAAGDPSPWFDGARAAALAHDAVELLRDAASHGLDPRDYEAAALAAALARADSGATHDAVATARLEQRLTAAMLRYLNDLRAGRVKPAELNAGFGAPRGDPWHAETLLASALVT
ncbi:MAG TPA: murein L,D-transpeptidase, partial [Burkholderiaceae bacterium]|nr:murein L,D-transpeptidase [Burkholderiaceae bacterium]